MMERGWSEAVINDLKSRGHEIEISAPAEFGGAQLIMRNGNRGYIAASDHRKDGHAAGF
jgi:gamma-glutamyltranspeptidase / glutathione hydrolase